MRSPTNPAADAALREYWQAGRANIQPLAAPVDITPAPAVPKPAVEIPARITFNQLTGGWLEQHGLKIISITLPDDLRDARCRVRATTEAKA